MQHHHLALIRQPVLRQFIAAMSFAFLFSPIAASAQTETDLPSIMDGLNGMKVISVTRDRVADEQMPQVSPDLRPKRLSDEKMADVFLVGAFEPTAAGNVRVPVVSSYRDELSDTNSSFDDARQIRAGRNATQVTFSNVRSQVVFRAEGNISSVTSVVSRERK